MRALVILLAAVLLMGRGISASAQTSAGQPPEPGVTEYPNPTGARVPSTNGSANPYATPVAPRHNNPNPYLNEANPYASTVAPRRTHPAPGPGETAATRQSGLSNVEARSISEQQGYTRIGEMHAEPSSIWVWQADAIKDGRRVRIGIDYRGNLLELG